MSERARLHHAGYDAGAGFEPEGERRGFERRSQERRAPRRVLDTLFAMSLVNQVAPAHETLARSPYDAEKRVRAGIWRDFRA